jgi:uncharacterized cupredoxin-like copper-binding protein
MHARRRISTHRPTALTFATLALAMVFTACSNSGPGTVSDTVVMIPGYQGGGQPATTAQPQGYTQPQNVIQVGLGDTSATSMYIHLSQDYAPAGSVTFLINNESTTMDHELVGFLSKTMAADYKITGFDGDPNKINEDTAGKSVIDTGAALKPGTSQMLTVPNMAPGHYSLVCNLSGHYKAGMHIDFWVTPKGSTPV